MRCASHCRAAWRRIQANSSSPVWPASSSKSRPLDAFLQKPHSTACSHSSSWGRHRPQVCSSSLGTSTTLTRRHAAVQPISTPGSDGGGSSSSSSSPQSSKLKNGLVFFLKGFGLWAPAVLFWISLVWDERTDEEVAEEEHEAQRLERFFDVDGVAEGSFDEWSAKEEALYQIIEKLLKSSRFRTMLERGLEDDAPGGSEAPKGAWASGKKSSGKQDAAEAAALDVEVSWIIPPVEPFDDAYPPKGAGDAAAQDLGGSISAPMWHPRIVLSHRSGAMALVVLSLAYVEKSKDRKNRWTCTRLRAELLAGPGSEPVGEPLCDLNGNLPHGVRYMRI